MNHPAWIIREKLANQFFPHLTPKYRVMAAEDAIRAVEDRKRRENLLGEALKRIELLRVSGSSEQSQNGVYVVMKKG
jgi:hypothetical protein